ncbi:MAG: hypothetical protein KFB93_08480 [Simkaniaceae bacterium]|nr:MAG: hypothetical protein KFB93_08480 [Simkaniaceae bacterium]
MKNIPHQRKNSQRFTKFFVGGVLFSVPRLFWMGIDRAFLPPSLLCNLFVQKALIAAANQYEQPLHLINTLDEKNLSPLDFTQEDALMRVQPHQAKDYLEQALLELGFKQIGELPPLSLIFPKKNFETATLLKTLKEIWEKELGIQSRLVSFPPKRGDQTLHLAFMEWKASTKAPLFLLDAFKRAADKLKPHGTCWEHPGYQSLFDKVRIETDLEQRKTKINFLEELVIQDLSILPLFYKKKVNY